MALRRLSEADKAARFAFESENELTVILVPFYDFLLDDVATALSWKFNCRLFAFGSQLAEA